MDARRSLNDPADRGSLDPIRLRVAPGTSRGDDVIYRLAQSRSDLEGAFRVLQERYAASGLTNNPNASLRVMPYHFWPDTQVMVAVYRDHIIGSVSLVRDSEENGLPMESNYAGEVEGLRDAGTRLGEVCCLCVGSDKSHSSGELFAGLTRLMMFHARHSGLDSIIAVVHPRHGKFYRMAMGFCEIGGLSACRHVAGNPGVPVMGAVNDRSRYRERWRGNYFDGHYEDHQLDARPMTMIDKAYFSRFSQETSSKGTRRAA